MIRLRNMDARKAAGKLVYRPMLLLSFNLSYVSMELAFSFRKGGSMETAGWVAFDANLPKDSGDLLVLE